MVGRWSVVVVDGFRWELVAGLGLREHRVVPGVWATERGVQLRTIILSTFWLLRQDRIAGRCLWRRIRTARACGGRWDELSSGGLEHTVSNRRRERGWDCRRHIGRRFGQHSSVCVDEVVEVRANVVVLAL